MKSHYKYKYEELSCTETELLNFKITLPLAKLDMVSSRLVSYGLIFLDDISDESKNCDNHHHL